MNTRLAFAKSLKQARKARGLTQEDFSVRSSRTYLSTLERGLKSPTLEKIEALANTMKIHPLTLLALTYLHAGRNRSLESLWEKISAEIQEIQFTGHRK